MFRILAQVNFNLPHADPSQGFVKTTILPLVFGLAGALAFLMIVIGGFQFVISRGDPGATAKARNTIIYSIVGLVIVLLGYGIVTFVVTKVIK